MLEPKGENLVLPLFSQVKKQRFTEAVYLAHVTQHTRASLFSLHPLPVTQPASFPLLSWACSLILQEEPQMSP